MKMIFSLAVVFSWLAAIAVASEFEGTVHMNLTAGKNTHQITYTIKGSKLRFDQQIAKGPTSAGLFDVATGEITVLMPEQKMYLTMGAPKVGLGADTKIEETGRTETIAGYPCSEIIVRDKKHVIEVWTTEALGKMPNLAEAFGNRGRRSAWENYAADKGLFALRVITRDRKGKERSRLECTEVKREDVADDLFAIPEAYTQLKMPGLGDLFGT